MAEAPAGTTMASCKEMPVSPSPCTSADDEARTTSADVSQASDCATGSSPGISHRLVVFVKGTEKVGWSGVRVPANKACEN